MREVHHGRRAVRLATVAMLTFGIVPGTTIGAAPTATLNDIPSCSHEPLVRWAPPDPGRPPARPTEVGAPVDPGIPDPGWDTTIDQTGTLRGHTLRLGDSAWHAGPRAFIDGAFEGTLIAGERSRAGTRLRLIDLARGCTTRTIDLRSLVYGSLLQPDGTLVVSLVERRTRAELGVWRIAPHGSGRPERVIAPPSGPEVTAVPREVTLLGSSLGIRARWCAAGQCVSRGRSLAASSIAALVDLDPDAETDNSALLPLKSHRPVPVYDRWFPWSVLSFRFHSADASPAWMRDAIQAAADDATDTSKSLSPIFTPSDGGTKGVIRYTTSFPSSCLNAIACASHDADAWTLRMRPHGYDFRWGALRWCQKTNSDGCFDAERVALHEFGHVVGLDHPESAGFRLPPSSTVMHQVSPSRPHMAWDRHGFGTCDVASLQEQYGTPTMSTLIATCNDVDTRLTLSASAAQVGAGGRLVLSATLRVRPDDAEYGALSGIRLNGRSVQIKRRLSGGSGAWTTSWMTWAEAPGLYTITLYPRSTYEYMAVFGSPDNEGLAGDTSNLVTVRIAGVCTGNCPSEEDPT
jgi:hypothetical protein